MQVHHSVSPGATAAVGAMRWALAALPLSWEGWAVVDCRQQMRLTSSKAVVSAVRLRCCNYRTAHF